VEDNSVEVAIAVFVSSLAVEMKLFVKKTLVAVTPYSTELN